MCTLFSFFVDFFFAHCDLLKIYIRKTFFFNLHGIYMSQPFFFFFFKPFCSGYDFGYLIKILTNSNLPEEELDFFEILRLFFPVIYDVKYLMKSCKNLKVRLKMTLHAVGIKTRVTNVKSKARFSFTLKRKKNSKHDN